MAMRAPAAPARSKASSTSPSEHDRFNTLLLAGRTPVDGPHSWRGPIALAATASAMAYSISAMGSLERGLG